MQSMSTAKVLNLMNYLDISAFDLTQDVADIERQVRDQLDTLCRSCGTQMARKGSQVARDIMLFGLAQLWPVENRCFY